MSRPLQKAVMKGDGAMVRVLLEAGANIDAADEVQASIVQGRVGGAAKRGGIMG